MTQTPSTSPRSYPLWLWLHVKPWPLILSRFVPSQGRGTP